MKRFSLKLLPLTLFLCFLFISGKAQQDNITINKTGDAFLNLSADTDDLTESDNAYIKLSQDGGNISGFIGITGDGHRDPLNAYYANSLANALLIGSWTHDSNYPALQFGTDNRVRMTILPSGNIGIGTNSPENKLHIHGDNPVLNIVNYNNIGGAGGTLRFSHTQNNTDPIGATAEIKTHVLHGGEKTADLKFLVNNGNGLQTNMVIRHNGRVGIGTSNPDAPLTVAGNIHAREIKVTATAGGADFVFADDYSLPKLEAVAAFVKQNKHLPEIPSAAEMEANGLHLAEMNIKLLQKVEELTLYAIEQETKLASQQEAIAAQQTQLAEKDRQLQELLRRMERLEKMME